MPKTKLILVEGIPSAGKTTMAGAIHRWLERNGFRSRLYNEGNLDHPADYEAVAYLPEPEYAALLRDHPDQRAVVARYSDRAGGGRLVYYAKLAEGEGAPDALIAALARRDVYELELETHQRLIRDRWRRFVESARAGDEVFVFECCYLQNLLTIAQLKHNLPRVEARRHVDAITEILRPLNPLLIYLSRRDVRAALQRVAAERPPQWAEHCGAYTDRGAWARATGRAGFDGFVTWLEARQSFELAYAAGCGLDHAVVDVTDGDWDAVQRRVAAFLRRSLIDRSS
jgi:hypothetical protein